MIDTIETNGGITFAVRVVPRASRSEIVSEIDGALKVRLASPPVDGAANAELIKLLAKQFRTSRNAVVIVSGLTSKTKRVRISGLTIDEVTAILNGVS